MEKELPKYYSPRQAEDKWYPFWEKRGFFRADPLSSKPPFCTMLPPPNVTGILHMGHAFVDTLQDVVVRYKRMCGFETLWVPGTDHAGISTQTIVERHLMQTEGKRREDYTRTDFLRRIWTWKKERERQIIHQLKQLGCSCDWTRHRFTMDAHSNRAVCALFKQMYDDGLIYRGNYLVNWDPITQTALADDEVEYEEQATFLWYVKYPLEDQTGYLTVATTRPETMLADVAVAVSKGDERYKKYVGKHLILPFAKRRIPILSDQFVDPTFGTGAVKITPAHDLHDYEMAKRHNLPLINLLAADGTLNEHGIEFQGLSLQKARSRIVTRLQEEGMLAKVEPYTNRVGVSYRSKGIIEPYLSKQWFVKMTAFKEVLTHSVASGRVKLFPKHWEQTYFHWIEHLRDWCISRQLWWGHQIPVWYHQDQNKRIVCSADGNPPTEVRADPNRWKQDEDVLDTWFSSSLWPISTLGWPDRTDELRTFYPHSTLITGHDILFFWVARMIMMGHYVMKHVPFLEVNLQGLIFGKSYWKKGGGQGITYISPEQKKDFDLGAPLPDGVFSKWEKMSKSKGNVIDPLKVIETYGTDALRMTLAMSATQAMQVDLDFRRFEELKHFTNKVWNGSRFVLIHLAHLTPEHLEEGIQKIALEDRWIISRLNAAIQKMHLHLKGYHFDRAAQLCYFFFWDEFCARYVEMSKPTLFGKGGNKVNKQKILLIVLVSALRLMHPFAPFITEEIFDLLKKRLVLPKSPNHITEPYAKETLQALNAPACMVSRYPQVICKGDINKEIEKQFECLCNIVYALRAMRSEMGLPPSQLTDLIVEGKGNHMQLLEKNQEIIASLASIRSIRKASLDQLHASAKVGKLKLMLPLPPALLEREKRRLIKEREKKQKQLSSTQHQLNNPHFIERAPKTLVEKTQQKLKELKEQLKCIEEELSSFRQSNN